MSKKAYKQFFHGKGVPKTIYGRKPFRWIPFSFIDTYHAQTGKFRARRKYGADGWAYKDMDAADERHRNDHVHDIINGKRFPSRTPNKREQAEINKAKKKRRFYND